MVKSGFDPHGTTILSVLIGGTVAIKLLDTANTFGSITKRERA